jgi:undecaprenyl phosphate N,N'-diacetylbacillosamine 1-phosphate transferase
MQQFLKRLFDIVLSLTAIILLSPLLLVLILTVRLSSPGQALFRQQRAGKDGKPFILYKFRTMKCDADPFGQSPKSGSDPRLIKFGRFMREYSLDELPQFFNVLKGDMSIVGPRPLYVSQVSNMTDHHRKRLRVRPGLTGVSQVYARCALTDEYALNLEAEYAENRNFWRDMKIFFLTFAVIFAKKDVYEK